MGRAAHQYSSTKVTLLQAALDSFITCSAVLPGIIPIQGDADGPEDSTSVSNFESDTVFNAPGDALPIGNFVSVIRDIIDKNIDSFADDPFVSGPEFDKQVSMLNTPSVNPPNQLSQTFLMPPPLKVRKSQEALNLPDQLPSGNTQASTPVTSGRTRRPPPLPIRIKPAEATACTHPGDSDLHASIPRDSQTQLQPQHAEVETAALVASPITPPRGAAIRRYNSSLRFLRVQITSSIASLRQLIAEVTGLQESRRAAKNFRRSSSFWTFSPVKSPSREGEEKVKLKAEGLDKGKASVMETKEQRIVRLKADGWKTVGLRSPASRWKGTEYYRRYCSSVLDELYLDS